MWCHLQIVDIYNYVAFWQETLQVPEVLFSRNREKAKERKKKKPKRMIARDA